ncbi:hypothetical protein WI560_23700 [Bradyrhizobium sp. A11]|uniref:hypothetical protein n=1 Tax=Bradyrhizobium sp. A11 TaxID=3133974 RepID=UPI003254A92A
MRANMVNVAGATVQNTRSETDTAVNSTSDINHVVNVLGSIVILARDLPEVDHARIRRFILACGDLMSSRDRLQSADRQLFEAALSNAASVKRGY